MLDITDAQIKSIGNVLNDPHRPLKERFRALFTLRNIGGPTSIECIRQAFTDSSALLKHELAYCLGQMQDNNANTILINILKDELQEPMVRHEAAEALGAIAAPDSLPILEKYVSDPVIEVAETCELAVQRIRWFLKGEENKSLSSNPYTSIDPAPPLDNSNVEQLQSILLNDEASLFVRYRAMFALRNIGTNEAILALCKALNHGSALFKHEIAFVLGQVQSNISVPFLSKSLEDSSENEMVRHECAEALGAIASEECYRVLNNYLHDEKRVVKESCEIALDMCEYENSPEFQYANALQTVS
ncbi:hypothetical protein Trydic_g13869 [Trypoxylus dichotomus]